MSKSRLFALLLCLPFLAAAKCVGDAPTGGGGGGAPAVGVFADPTAGSELGLNDTQLGKSDLGQSFVTNGGAVSVSGIKLRLKAVSPLSEKVTGTLTAKLEPDNANAPVGSPLAGANRDASTVAVGTDQVYDFVFAQPVNLAAGTRYWVVLHGDYNPNSTQLIKWMASSANPSIDGAAAYLNESGLANNGEWTTQQIGENRDLIFSLETAAPVAAPTTSPTP